MDTSQGETKAGTKATQQATQLENKYVLQIIDARIDMKCLTRDIATDETKKKFQGHTGSLKDYKNAATAYCDGQKSYLTRVDRQKPGHIRRVPQLETENKLRLSCSICIKGLTTTFKPDDKAYVLFQKLLVKSLVLRIFNTIRLIEDKEYPLRKLDNEHLFGMLALAVGCQNSGRIFLGNNNNSLDQSEIFQLILRVLDLDKKTEINFLVYWEGKNFTGYAAESILANDNECTYKREYFKMKYRVIEFVESNKKRGSVIIERMAPRQAGIFAMKQVLKELQDYENDFKNKTSAFENSAAVKH